MYCAERQLSGKSIPQFFLSNITIATIIISFFSTDISRNFYYQNLISWLKMSLQSSFNQPDDVWWRGKATVAVL